MDSIKKYIEQNRKNLFRDPYMQSTLNVLFERERLFSPISDLETYYAKNWPQYRNIIFPRLYKIQNYIRHVCYEYGLRPKTAFLAMNIVERYIAIEKHTLEEYYLDQTSSSDVKFVIVTCLFIAVKYDEVCSIGLDNIVDCFENSDTKEECEIIKEKIIQMEKNILFTLEFELTIPVTIDFFKIFVVLCKLDAYESFDALCLLERASAYIYSSNFKYSELTSSACLVVMGDDRSRYNAFVVEKTTYSQQSLSSCIFYLSSLVDDYNRILFQEDEGTKYRNFISN